MARTDSLWRRWELPTWLLAGVVYGGWAALTWSFHRLPPWLIPLVLPTLGGFWVAWHGSLQHETIHGHPSRSQRVNELVAFLPLGLWMPYRIYRESHLAHHQSAELTHPDHDPESAWVGRERWRAAGPLLRLGYRVHATLLGRLTLGPVVAVSRLLRGEGSRLRRGDFSHLGAWALHGLGVAAVLTWLLRVCHMPVHLYVLAVAYPAMALTLLRSYAEHRPALIAAHRTAIIDAHPLLSLLYLNNNLHALHHARPDLAWFDYRREYRRERSQLLSANGGYHHGGYLELWRRYAVRPRCSPLYPDPAASGSTGLTAHAQEVP